MTVDPDTYRIVLLGIEQYLRNVAQEATAAADLIHMATTDEWKNQEQRYG